MRDDDEVCLCFHVTLRKVKNFIRVEKPKYASQISQCGGAGTGCGWCRPILKRLLESQQKHPNSDLAAPLEIDHDSQAYRQGREDYLKSSGKSPSKPGTQRMESDE